MEMITLEQYEQIRRMYHLEEKSGRQIARELSCSRQTVSRALSLEQPPAYTMSRARSAPVLGPYQAKLEALLAENQRLPKKQRYTAHKLFQLIQAEGYGGSEAGVQMYAVRWCRDAFEKSSGPSSPFAVTTSSTLISVLPRKGMRREVWRD